MNEANDNGADGSGWAPLCVVVAADEDFISSGGHRPHRKGVYFDTMRKMKRTAKHQNGGDKEAGNEKYNFIPFGEEGELYSKIDRTLG